VRIFVTALLVQREVGGNLAEILDKISHTIRARFTIRRQLRVFTAQGRMSGYVLGAMPIVVGLGLYALNPEYIELLFTETIGRFLLIGALTMQIIGYLWIRKIVNIEI
jgi:tight adherence protein B